MHNRQSGAAYVPLVFFLILLVLFLGVLAFGYSTLTKNNELETEVKTLREQHAVDEGRVLIRDHYIEDIGKVVNLPATSYLGRPASKDAYKGASVSEVPALMDPTALQAKMDAFATQMGVTSARSLEGLFTSIAGASDAKTRQIADIAAERDKVVEQKRAVDASFEKSRGDNAKAQQETKDLAAQQRQDFESQKDNYRRNLEATQQNLRDAQSEASKANEAAAAERKHMTAENNKLRGQNTAYVSKLALRNLPDVADGKIIVARNNVATAFINLGRKDMLTAGTIFRVKNPKADKNGDKVKAYATVTKVEQERSEVLLTNVADALGDPVREGDELFNELYSPGETRNIFLLGRFDYPTNKPELETLLKRLGNKVYTKMIPGVDLVILGNDVPNAELDGVTPITDSPEYKEALNLGVEFAPLRKIRDLIKLP